MENSALNKAHEAGREAVRLQRKGLYGQAAERHLRAAELLYDIQQKISQGSVVATSLDEQTKYHRRQAELAQVLREITEKNKSSSVPRMADKSSTMDGSSRLERVRKLSNNAFQLPVPLLEIRKNFDEADSLLQILSDRNGPNSQQSPRGQQGDPASGRPLGFTRRPKNDAEVIEELQMVNSNLRSHVDKLLKELQDAKAENNMLRSKLEMYEKDGAGKPVLSSASLLSQALEQLPPRELPELAPLETPEFDFNA